MEAEYDNPYEAHALMEPINATAHFKGDSCEVWVGTQSGERVATEVQKDYLCSHSHWLRYPIQCEAVSLL